MIARARWWWLAVLLGSAACASGQGGSGGGGPQPQPQPGAIRRGADGRPVLVAFVSVPPAFPDTGALGTPVLVAARGPDTALWVGTYGRGLFVARQRARTWQRFAADSAGLASNVVDAVGFTRRGAVWYGTVGSGFGRSADGGKTWRNWGPTQLGPEWQYVAPDGIRGRGDTLYIATADGLRVTGDDGASWRCVRATGYTAPAASASQGGCMQTIASLPNDYLLSLDVAPDGAIWVGHLRGLSVSRDQGRTWTAAPGVPTERVRAVRVASDSSIWVATETAYYRASNLKATSFKPARVDVPGYGPPPGAARAFVRNPVSGAPAIVSSKGLLVPEPGDTTFHLYIGSGDIFHPAADLWTGVWDPGRLLPITGSDVGFAALLPIRSHPWDLVDALPGSAPADPKHPWLARPLGDDANPYIDQTYRYGSTFDGQLQQHQGIEFNEPAGTSVRAIADGTVVWAGPGEAGAETIALRHDQRAGDRYVFSVYYHNSRIDVRPGQHVRAGDVIGLVGHSGRATNNHLHLEVHVAPTPDSSKIVSTTERFLPFVVNPQLWIAPLPGTGVVAGRVLDFAGKPVPGARVYGFVLPYPSETPLAFTETYRDRAHPDPAYDENFAVGDVPPGHYLVAALIDGKPIWRTLDVAAGKVSWVEFRPTTATP